MDLLNAQQLRVKIADTCVCEDLNLSVNHAESWAILGRNGVGKTTLLHSLAGLRALDAGEIRLQGSELARLGRRQIAQQVGLLPQHHQDNFPVTVLETALLGRHPHISAWGWEDKHDHDIAANALRTFSLLGMENRLVSTLSGGERRRLAMATLMTQDPSLFLLDEPTNHLDLNHQIHMLKQIREQVTRKQKAVIMVLHDLNVAARYCNRFLLLFGDGKTEQGDADAMLTLEKLSRLYQYDIQSIDTPQGTVFLPKY